MRPTPTFVATSNAASTATVPAPSGIAEGDLLIHAVGYDPNTGKANDYLADGWWPLGGCSASYYSHLFLTARWVEAGEPSSYYLPGTTDYDVLHVLVAYRGVRLVVPHAYGAGSASNSGTIPSFNTVEDNALVVLVTEAHAGSGPSWTWPAGFTETSNNTRWFPVIGTAAKEQATAGPTGSLSFSVTNYLRDYTQGVALALYP